MTETVDVVIAGGGIMGSSTAYFLTANPAFDGNVVVVERDPTYETASTTLSWGGVRQQFSLAENIQMSLFGIRFVKEAAESLAVDGEIPDFGFHEQGYLFLASESGLPVLEANCRLQTSLGATTILLTPDEVAERFPWMNTEDLAGAGYGPENEGWVDPSSLLQAFRRKARAQGARYLQDEVVAIARSNDRVTGVTLKEGDELACGTLVNAAGPHAGALAALADVDLPVRPRKRMSYVFDCREDLLDAPLTISANGVAFRPEGRQYIGTVSPEPDQDPDSNDLELEYQLFEDVIWPTIAHRVPAFEAIKLVRAWAGHYDYNTLDQNGIIGPHPEIDRLLFCNGFSGHGLQQGPAAGRAIAELIVHGAYRSIDLSALGFERILENRAVREANIV